MQWWAIFQFIWCQWSEIASCPFQHGPSMRDVQMGDISPSPLDMLLNMIPFLASCPFHCIMSGCSPMLYVGVALRSLTHVKPRHQIMFVKQQQVLA